jgi:hypothetical protein
MTPSSSRRALVGAIAVGGSATALLATAAPASAHAGHSSGGVVDDARHLVFGIEHAPVAVALVVAVIVLIALGAVSALAGSGRLTGRVPDALTSAAARTGIGVGLAAAGAGLLALS